MRPARTGRRVLTDLALPRLRLAPLAPQALFAALRAFLEAEAGGVETEDLGPARRRSIRVNGHSASAKTEIPWQPPCLRSTVTGGISSWPRRRRRRRRARCEASAARSGHAFDHSRCGFAVSSSDWNSAVTLAPQRESDSPRQSRSTTIPDGGTTPHCGRAGSLDHRESHQPLSTIQPGSGAPRHERPRRASAWTRCTLRSARRSRANATRAARGAEPRRWLPSGTAHEVVALLTANVTGQRRD